MPAPIARLRRVTDLFVTGTEHYVGESDDGPVLIWIRKPNSFERQECQRDGLFGQAKVIAVLHDKSEEIVQVREDAERRGIRALIDDALEQKGMEFAYKGRQDVEADEDWAERLPLVQRAGLLEEGSAVTQEERRAITLAQAQFVDAIRAAAEVRRKDARAELERMPDEDILQQYIDGFRTLRGHAAYNEEYTLTELSYAMRECNAVAIEGGWDHATCSHRRMFTDIRLPDGEGVLTAREQVRDQPDELLAPAMATLRALMATPAEAGNSDAPSTSSGSSEQPSSAEASSPSTPSAT